MYTHNQLTYGASEIEPELYSDIHSLVKPIFAPNLTLKSDWGEGLKATGEWRAKMEQKSGRGRKPAETSYGRFNDAVHPSFSDTAAHTQNDTFYKWVRKQRLYYGDILNEDAAAKVDSWLRGASEADRKEFIETFRDLNIAAKQDMSDSLYKQDYRLYRPGTREPSEANGSPAGSRPRTVPSKKASRSASPALPAADAQRALASAGSSRSEGPATKRSVHWQQSNDSLAPYKSDIPIKWSGAKSSHFSSYRTSFKGRQGQELSVDPDAENREKNKVDWTAVTTPFGSLNPLFYKHGQDPGQNFYCVPRANLHRKGLVHGKPEEKNHTTHRMTYMRRSEKDLKELAKKAAEQVAASKAARYTSSIPLGHQGIMSLPSWGTSNAGYGSRDTAGLVLDKNEAARNKQVHSGITAPIGASAPADTSVADFVCT
jgi:hypothetical protein